ncbi:MAG TPA: DNA replication and repair protein RecF [Candidatus Dojkabacteria bacterium]|nr:DNA replication and repair protein RecF [Candidatus Dojkabacteria bacterium]
MIIRKLELKNFRNLDIAIEPSSGFNLILGQNGVGKSNLLDALYHLALVKSFKPYTSRNNVNFNSQGFASIKAELDQDGLSKELKIVFSVNEDSERKRLEVNSKPTTRSRFINNLTLILFAPHNTNLLVSTPDVRRSELDDFGSAVDFKYAMKLAEYKNVLRTRNSLLKVVSEGFGKLSELDYWDNKLAQLGGELVILRQELFMLLQPLIKELSSKQFDTELSNIVINYESKMKGDDPVKIMSEKITLNRNKEIGAGQSLYGPHKDDFNISSNEKDLKLYGSRGQQRIATLLLKLAMWRYLEQLKQVKPIILLDDAMAELDDENRLKLQDILSGLKAQTFIATTHKEDYSTKLLKKMQIITLD